jgi:glycine/D-amino acid oxidase-like deaminating enzyme
MTNPRILPRDDGPTGWAAVLPRRRPRPALQGGAAFDWAVLGAGFTGLAAARAIAEARPGDTIAVVDALEVGEGASGRNSGFAIDHAHTLGGGSAAEESARAQKRLYTAALDHLGELVRAHGIDCDWRACGKIHAAASARGAEKYLKPLLAELDHIGEDYEWLSGEEMRAAIGITHYEAGIDTPGTVLVNPAALVRGLADHLPANVTLYENTPITEIKAGAPLCLGSAKGRLTAQRLIVATNAFTPAAGFARNRLMPFVAFASLTRPMTGDEQEALGGRPTWGVTPANAFVAPTIQRTGDHRILYRDGIHYRPGLSFDDDELEAVRECHAERFRARFPMLADLELDHTWGGYLCMSRNQDSVFGALGDNIWGAAGFQGIGVTRGTIAGRLVAEMAMGVGNPLIDDMMRIAHPPANPPRPVFDWAVRARTAWEAWRERDEQ